MKFRIAWLLLASGLAVSSHAVDKHRLPTISWQEGKSGCTFVRGEDGKYRYGLQTGDLRITMAIDSQELQRARRRLDPFIAILLRFDYRGPGSREVSASTANLEFVSHQRVVHGALDPEEFSEQYAEQAEAAAKINQREIEKHAEKKAMLQTRIDATEKELVEVQEFLSAHAFKPATLTADSTTTEGWIFFHAKDKWIGEWKTQEEFVLRIPLERELVQFPFRLPPEPGELLLRKRQ